MTTTITVLLFDPQTFSNLHHSSSLYKARRVTVSARYLSINAETAAASAETGTASETLSCTRLDLPDGQGVELEEHEHRKFFDDYLLYSRVFGSLV